MDEMLIPMVVGPLAMAILFIGLPWLILHYITTWKKGGGGLSAEDEKLLDELHELGRRLDDRVATIERIMTAENPGWRHQIAADQPSVAIEDRNPSRRIVQ